MNRRAEWGELIMNLALIVVAIVFIAFWLVKVIMSMR